MTGDQYPDFLGTQIGDRYVVASFIGSGGNAAVFQGQDTKLKRDVAIKVSTKTTPQATKRFLAEAQRMARLVHPNILLVLDYGTIPGGFAEVPYIVTELLTGETLADLRDQQGGRMTPADVLGYLDSILIAIGHAHTEGVIHRDLHPGNVMLDSAGNPKLLDFGLAKSDDDEQTRTQTGLLTGVTGYVAPERYARAHDPSIPEDPRGDLWSVGILCFDLLVGRIPWKGPPAQMPNAIQTLPPEKLTEVLTDPHLAPLDDMLSRLLAKKPADRPASAAEARELLMTTRDKLVESQAISVRASTLGQTPSDRERKREQRREQESAGSPESARGYWWVNQGRSFDDEERLGILRSGTSHWTHRTMLGLAPGDLVLHSSRGMLIAVSQVEQPASEKQPGRLEAKTHYRRLPHPISLREIPEDLTKTERTDVGGPFRSDGHVHQGYLFKLSPKFAGAIAQQFPDFKDALGN